ncbi:MAG: BolA family protein [Rickettsiales bacterium]
MRAFLTLILKMREWALKPEVWTLAQQNPILLKKRMSRKEQIEQRLHETFAPTELVVLDDSAKHAGHAGAQPEGQTHYSVEIIAEAFRGKSRVESHRMVYEALHGMFEEGLHALAISAKA